MPAVAPAAIAAASITFAAYVIAAVAANACKAIAAAVAAESVVCWPLLCVVSAYLMCCRNCKILSSPSAGNPFGATQSFFPLFSF